MLTCKSLFGLGYRGERLIEPFYSRNLLWWLRVLPERDALVVLGQFKGVGSDDRQDRQIAGTRC